MVLSNFWCPKIEGNHDRSPTQTLTIWTLYMYCTGVLNISIKHLLPYSICVGYIAKLCQYLYSLFLITQFLMDHPLTLQAVQ